MDPQCKYSSVVCSNVYPQSVLRGSSNEDDEFVDSDVAFDAVPIARPSTPIPFWLRDDVNIPGI